MTATAIDTQRTQARQTFVAFLESARTSIDQIAQARTLIAHARRLASQAPNLRRRALQRQIADFEKRIAQMQAGSKKLRAEVDVCRTLGLISETEEREALALITELEA